MELLLMLAAATNRLTEIVKASFLTNANLSDEVKHALTIAISLLLGIIAAFGANVTLAALFPDNALLLRVPEVVGTIALGLLIGSGASAIHAVLEFLDAMRGRVAPPMVTALSGRKATIARVQTDIEAVG